MAFAKKKSETVEINPPNICEIKVKIRGTAPFVQLRFWKKDSLEAEHKQGSKAKASKRKKEARDFDAEYKQAMHISEKGWHGIPAPAFRNAMIDACRTVGLEMTRAKMAVFVIADGIDRDEGTPLVKITKGKPEKHISHVRNATGVVDLRARAMWREWEATVKLQFDGDMLSPSHVVNLLHRAGLQVGVGEGRPFSKKSAGQGWGTFEVVEQAA